MVASGLHEAMGHHGIRRLPTARHSAGTAGTAGTAPRRRPSLPCPPRCGRTASPRHRASADAAAPQLGLDMLKRFQACVDLRENVLRIGDAVVPFLGEGDVPSDERVGAGADEQLDLDESGRTALERSAAEAEGASSAAAAPPAPAAAAPASQGGDGPSEAALAGLMEMGFDRAQAQQALAATDGNAELAAAMLLG